MHTIKTTLICLKKYLINAGNKKRGKIMNLHNQHVVTALNYEMDKRIKELPADSPHGDYIYYSFQDAINQEKDEDNEWGEK